MTEAPINLENDQEPTLHHPETLDQRIRRLEEAVAALQDTSLVEDRLMKRLAQRLEELKAQAIRGEAATMIIEADRHLLPAPVHTDAADATKNNAPPHAPTSRWLIADLYADARTMFDMYLDRRYRSRMTWRGRIAPPVLLAAIATSWIWLPGTMILPSFISFFMVKTADLVLAYFLFKILGQEIARYREMVPTK